MSARLEAAVKAWDHYWGDRYGDEAPLTPTRKSAPA